MARQRPIGGGSLLKAKILYIKGVVTKLKAKKVLSFITIQIVADYHDPAKPFRELEFHHVWAHD
jgi:hypothetical protein